MMTDDRAYAGWTQQAVGIIRKVEEFNTTPMLTSSAVYDNLQGMAKELQVGAKAFRENPRKYLRFKLF